jgi:hypothetical protein
LIATMVHSPTVQSVPGQPRKESDDRKNSQSENGTGKSEVRCLGTVVCHYCSKALVRISCAVCM